MMNFLATLGPAQIPDITDRASRVAMLDGIIQYSQQVLTLEKRPSPLYVDVETEDPKECVCSTVPVGCCANYLVQTKSPASARYKCRGMTVLDYAILRNHSAIVQTIVTYNRAARYWRSNWCEAPMHKAVMLGLDGIVQILLSLDAAGPSACPFPANNSFSSIFKFQECFSESTALYMPTSGCARALTSLVRGRQHRVLLHPSAPSDGPGTPNTNREFPFVRPVVAPYQLAAGGARSPRAAG